MTREEREAVRVRIRGWAGRAPPGFLRVGEPPGAERLAALAALFDGPVAGVGRAWLEEVGWAEFGGAELFGVGDAVPPHLDLLEVLPFERQAGSALPRALLPLENDGFGNLACLELTGAGRVVLWDHEGGAEQVPELLAPDLVAWLEQRLAEELVWVHDPRDAMRVGELVDFWFALPRARWWAKDPAFDALLRERFLALHEAVAPTGHLGATPREALGLVLALDQLPRNLFRDTPRAFATDAAARAVTEAALARGFDDALGPYERAFLAMPLMHSEDRADQARCVALFSAHGPAEYVTFAERHRAIVDRFGRFPHRNAILGRSSTPEEEAFLREPGSSF